MKGERMRMFEFLSRMFSFVEDSPGSTEDHILETAMEGVVDGTDARLRALSDYKKRLRPATETSLAFVRQIESRLRAPARLSRAGFGADPCIHALFGSADSMHGIVSRDPNIRSFLEGATLAPEFYAILMARRDEKHILGARLTGNVMQSDVPQSVLSFSDHRLMAVSETEEGMRALVKRDAFRQLVHWALATLTAMKSGSTDRRTCRLRERLASLSWFHSGNEQPFWLHFAGQEGDPARRQAQTDRRKTERPGPPCSLDDYLTVVVEVLSHPERYLRLGTFSATVDRLGVMLGPEEESGIGVDCITLSEVTMPDQPEPVVFLPVRISRSEVLLNPGLNLDALY